MAVTMLTMSARAPASAQRAQTATTPRPGWLPREVFIDNLTAAHKAAAIARLEQIERILLQVPELANPQGFELRSQFHGGARQLGPGDVERPGNVIEYVLRLWFFAPTEAIAGEGCTCITITVNDHSPFGAAPIRDEQGRIVYVEAERGDPVPLATQVYGRFLEARERSSVRVLLTSGGELPWTTVTREELYNAVIFETEGKDGAKLADYRKALETTPYQEWLDGAAERRQEREATLRTAATLQTPAEVAKLRRLLEDTEREVTDRLKASEATDRAANQAALASSHARTESMRAELEAMTAAERRMPALIDMTRSDGPYRTGWRLTDVDAPTVWRVLTPDYDFWRARRSPVEVRSISVHIGASATGLVPAVHKALWQTYQKLDWVALNRLLDAPR